MLAFRYILVFLNITFNLSLLYSDWKTFGANDEKTFFTESFISTPVVEMWRVQIPGDIISSPIIYKDKVFITTRFGYLVALDLKTGQWLWDYSTSGFNDSTPYISSDTLILSSMDSELYAFDLNVDTSSTTNAKIKWIFNLGAPSVSSPLVYKNKIYIGVGLPENALCIIDFNAGNLISKKQFQKPINSVIGVCLDRIIFGGNDGKIYSITSDGRLMTSYQTSGGSYNMKAISCDNSRLYSLPGYDERRLYINRSTDTSLILKSADLSGNLGTSEWNWQDASSVALSTDTIYFMVGTSSINFVALNKSDLSLKFLFGPVGNISDYKILPSPAIVGNKILFTSTDGKFYIFSSTGGLLQFFQLDSPSYSSLAISDGWIVIAQSNGLISAYKSEKYLFFDTPKYNDIITTNPEIKINFKDNPDSYILDYSSYTDDNFILISSGSLVSGEYSSYKLIDFNINSIPNGDYKLRVRLFNSNNLISYSTIKIKINQKPSSPLNLVAIDNPNDNCNKIKLTFNSVSGVIGYNIYRSSYGLNNWSLITSTSSTTYIDKTAFCGSTFSYRVTSYDDWVESDYSNISFAYSINDNPLNDTISPADVMDLSSIHSLCPGVISYRFTQVGDDGNFGRAAYYDVAYSTVLPFVWDNAIKIRRDVFSMPYDIESGIIDGLLYGSTYYISVRVYDYANNYGTSNILVAHTLPDVVLPSPPSNFKAYDTDGDRGGRITLEWSKSPSEDFNDCDKLIYGYKIFRTTKTFDYSKPYVIVDKYVYGYIDTNATTGVKYYYKVCAYDSTNYSCSDSVSATSADNFRYVSMRNGGALLDNTGSAVIINENSLNQDDYLIFYRVKQEEITTMFQSSSFKTYSDVSFKTTNVIYKFESSNSSTKLNSYATIKLFYSSTEIASIDENDLRIYYYDGRSWNLLKNSNPNPEENYVTAEYDKFGYYALFGYMPQGDVFDSDWIYTYPNPAKGGTLTFKFVVNYNSNIKIEIYNVAGELVKRLEKKNAPAGIINEIIWDIRNIASGVYIYVFEAEGSKGKKRVKKKLAIIH